MESLLPEEPWRPEFSRDPLEGMLVFEGASLPLWLPTCEAEGARSEVLGPHKQLSAAGSGSCGELAPVHPSPHKTSLVSGRLYLGLLQACDSELVFRSLAGKKHGSSGP